MRYLAFRQLDHDQVNAVIPAVGTVGALAFFPLMMYNLYTREPKTFSIVLGIAVVVIAVELLYFERDIIEEEIKEFAGSRSYRREQLTLSIHRLFEMNTRCVFSIPTQTYISRGFPTRPSVPVSG